MMAKKYPKRRLLVVDRFVNNSDLGKLILRLLVGLLLLFHGIDKLQHGYGFVEQMLVKTGFPGYFSSCVRSRISFFCIPRLPFQCFFNQKIC